MGCRFGQSSLATYLGQTRQRSVRLARDAAARRS